MLINIVVLYPVYIILEIFILTVNVVQPKLFCYPGQYQKSNLNVFNENLAIFDALTIF